MARTQPTPSLRPTIRDVAAQAGVSVSSVSRVLNREPHISPELHARIMRVVDRLGFEPDSAAQALRSRASNTIGCMVSDISNPLYSEMVNAAEEELQRAGYVLMLGATRHAEERETAFISAVRRRRMDGLLLFAGDNTHKDFTSALATLDLPCVGIDREVPGAPSVRADHRGGGFEVTRYLIGLGHRRIALLTGPAAVLPSTERVAGYRQAHIEAGLEVDLDLVRPQVHGSGIAFSDVCQLLQGPAPPTAIITLGTHMLASVMDALASNGIRYPGDISLVCIGDTDLARHATPAISALTWDLSEIGRIAAKTLLERVRDGDQAQDTRPIYLPTRFILRHSCAEPRAQ
ncbi:LacI family DNA-binding transcriptional regulator [Bradyrhizobium sp. AUGA SZCCT0182]|uniref:LacI family DNA-binding transcriptional regulator n=1 Tax=Bradyrhizobium sp. AUGA SZCCT0182 TaxID=2807667 RepID=UPI001BA9D29F|nr:LacI family DNA-binding transcriptional regulator [Bradyrhizobium sp. AUGA SZCCT0182]MBR1235755.1 LacI family DNA-binding transcriptional regulator [Bradyrhizobium sp. AUGA SZCCT0182]